jgi:hypothetical protein
MLKGLNITVFSFFREKVTNCVVLRSVEHSRSETTLCNPASRSKEEQPTQGRATHWGSPHGDAVRQRANSDGLVPRQDTERIVRESSHGNAACEQRMARKRSHGETASEWRGSHPTARQLTGGEGAISW